MGAVITTTGVHHVAVCVRDVDEALTFYRDVLGLTPLPRPETPFPGAWLLAGAVQLHLMANPGGPLVPDMDVPAALVGHHVSFGVEDLDVTVAALEARGMTVTVGEIVRQAFVRDGSGNIVELTEVS